MNPMFKPRNIKFAGQTNSNDFNNMSKEIALDLFNLYENISKNEEVLDNVIDILQINNQYLTNRITHLENQIKHMKRGIEYLEFYDSSIISYGDDLPIEPIPENERAYINYNYNIATLHSIYNDSKTFLTDIHEKEFFVPEDLVVTILETSYPGAEIEEKDPYNAFDQNITTAWKRKVVFPKGVAPDFVRATMDIKLPLSIINNMIVNTIFINPFPDASINIVDILYKPLNGSDYISFIDTDFFKPVRNANNIAITFEDIQPSNIRIVFEQDKPIDIDNGDKAMFVLGAQNIAIYNRDYTDISSFYIHFKPVTSVDQINNIEILVDNTKNENAVSYTIYGLNKEINSLKEIDLEKPISYNYNNEFWIKVDIHKIEDVTTPIIKGLIIEYDPLIM